MWTENKNTNKLHLYMKKHFQILAMQCTLIITSLVNGLVVAVHNICYLAHLTPAPRISICWVTRKMVYWGWHWSSSTLILNLARDFKQLFIFFLTLRRWQIHKYWESDPCVYEIPKWESYQQQDGKVETLSHESPSISSKFSYFHAWLVYLHDERIFGCWMMDGWL